jgi:hypothetical protein
MAGLQFTLTQEGTRFFDRVATALCLLRQGSGALFLSHWDSSDSHFSSRVALRLSRTLTHQRLSAAVARFLTRCAFSSATDRRADRTSNRTPSARCK